MCGKALAREEYTRCWACHHRPALMLQVRLRNPIYLIIGVSAPEKKQPALTGLLGSAYAVALIIRPLAERALIDRITWRW